MDREDNEKWNESKIVRYGSANDIDIKFSNGTIVMHKTYANFCSGSVACK